MDIIVCIKRVPNTAEVPIEIAGDSKSIKLDKLTFDINEPDNYALEEALLLKEKQGGAVTLICIGDKESEEVLRMGLAKGADAAVRIWDDSIAFSDPFVTASILSKAAGTIKYDLIMTGCMAFDDGYAQVGPMLSQILAIPHAAIVTKVEISEKSVKVQRELEGGMYESLDMTLPALFSIQTGINEPRYASMVGIRKAAQKEIKVMGLSDIGLGADAVGEAGSKVKLGKLFIPPVDKKAEILEGSAEETSAKLAEVLKGKGVLS
ncbi:electron transfer flavoprotein subunit beta/FixA family protein [Spirochaetota bacterium]